MKNQQCKHFNRCNAPICPLDEQYINCVYLQDEPICYYLKEGVKPNGIERLRGAIGEYATKKVQDCIELLQSPHRPPNFGNMARKLAQAKTTKSRLKVSVD